MAPLRIQVTGNHSITLAAERAILYLHISSTGILQTQVSHTVTTTSNHLQTMLKSLSPKTLSGDTQPDAPVTKWTMSSLSTGTWLMHTHTTKSPQRTYSASTDFEVKFQDFEKLGAVATEMAEMTGVEVRRVQWVLTEETEARYGKVARVGAVKDAMEKASDYASAAGKDTLTVVDIMEGSVGSVFGAAAPSSFVPGGPVTRGFGSSEEQRLSFEPMSRDVSCQVRAVFEAE